MRCSGRWSSERKTITVEQLLAKLAEAGSSDDILDAFGQCEPPTDPMEQEVLRERLVRALEGKVKRPGAFVDAWLKRAPSADELARIAKDATLLVRLALEHAVLFHDRSQEPYALIEAGGHKETHRIGSRYFKRWLSKLYYEDANAKPERSPDESTLAPPSARCRATTAQSPTPKRSGTRCSNSKASRCSKGRSTRFTSAIAQLGEYIYLDLGDEAWRGVEITRTGWKVIDAPPVRFIRPEGMLPLPEPVAGGELSKLREFLNVSDDDWPLVAGYEIGLTRPRGPYPVLELLGEQGSAKSSAGRFIRRVVDPYSPLDRGQPRSEHDLVIAASRQWVMSYDNLSWLPDWLSDAFARISTGGGFGARALYTDDEEKRFDAMRPIILNGIEDLASRGDLLDRAIIVNLQPIEDEARKEESELEAEFLEAWPKLLGAVLDGTVTALANVGDVKIDRLPRMADFTVWVVAAEPALGIEEGSFLDAYRGNREEAAAVALEASIVAVELRRFMQDRKSWGGIATDLLREVNNLVDEDVKALKEWPKTGRGLSGKLRRLAPGLRRSGIRLEFDRVGHGGTRTITVTRTQPASHGVGDQPSPSSPPSPDGDDGDGADGRSHTSSPPRRARMSGPPEGDGSPADGEFHPGDIVRRLGGLRNRLFKVKAVVGDTVHCWELEGDAAGELRSFPVGDLILVRRAEES